MGYRQVNFQYCLCDNCNNCNNTVIGIVNLIVQFVVTFLNRNTKLSFVWLDKTLFTHTKYKLNYISQQAVSMQVEICAR